MGLYQPPGITTGTPFRASEVSSGLDNVGRVLNSTVGDDKSGEGNLRNDRTALTRQDFRPNALTHVFNSEGFGDEVFLYIWNPVVATTLYGGYQNKYDVAGTSIAFYLKKGAAAQFVSRVNLQACEDGQLHSLGAAVVNISVVATLLLDGTSRGVATLTWTNTLRTSRGGQVLIHTFLPYVAPGYHTAHMNLNLTAGTVTGATSSTNGFAHISGEGGSTTVTAFYM